MLGGLLGGVAAGRRIAPGAGSGCSLPPTPPIWCGFAPKMCETSRPMKPIVKLLHEGGSLNSAQMAQILKLSEADVERELNELKQQGILLGFRPVLNLSHEDSGIVRAVIEVR